MANNANNEVVNYINNLAETKKVSVEVVCAALADAIKKAYEKEMAGEVADVEVDATTGAIKLHKVLTVIDDATVPEEENEDTHQMEKVYDENSQMLLSEAIKVDKNAQVGSTVKKLVDLQSLERRVILHMLQVFKHDINIETNKTIYQEWIGKKGTIIEAEVEKIDSRNRSIIVNLGNEQYGIVSRNDQNPDEHLIEGAKYKFYIKDVLEQSKNWPIVLSRASGEIVKDLLTMYIPEISNGAVSIVKVGRAAGFKSKVAVKSNQPGIDPIGACIGARADRIKPIINEMGNEKIEFVEYSEDINKYLVLACLPAPLVGFNIIEPTYEVNELTGEKKEITRKKIQLIVDDYKLALIIGSRGKNVRVLSELLDADVEAITTDEANETNLKYTKAVVIRKPFVPGQTKTPVNKFDTTYNKHHDSNDDVLSSIDHTNEVVDDATIVPEVNEEPVVQQGEKVDDADYADELAELNEITGTDSSNKSDEEKK